MEPIKAVGFDLFNTLILAEPGGVDLAMDRITSSLRQAGISLEPESFKAVYRQEAVRFVKAARREGKVPGTSLVLTFIGCGLKTSLLA